MGNPNENLTPAPTEQEFGQILAILDTSAGDRLKEAVLKRIMPNLFGERLDGFPRVAEAAFAAVALAREFPIPTVTEVKAGPVPAKPKPFIPAAPAPAPAPAASRDNIPPLGYRPGENILKPVDRQKEAEVMRGMRFEDEPSVAKKDAALTASPRPATPLKPAQKVTEEDVERVTVLDRVYIPVAAVARCSGGVHPRAIAHRCDKLGFKCVKNTKGTGMMIIEKDALAVIASFK